MLKKKLFGSYDVQTVALGRVQFRLGTADANPRVESDDSYDNWDLSDDEDEMEGSSEPHLPYETPICQVQPTTKTRPALRKLSHCVNSVQT